MEWILASQSPRRKELFGELVQQFDIIPARGEETLQAGLSVEEQVQALAWQKAKEISSQSRAAGKWVLGADTIVVLDDEILGKPKDEADAVRMLNALSGRTHKVLTGVCMMRMDENGNVTSLCDVACTNVRFFTLTQEQIKAYVATGSPMDKAGAYGIQDGGLVEKIEGSFSNVVGLPIELCGQMLAKINEEK